jgi:c-di-GMP-related signal transduction protein
MATAVVPVRNFGNPGPQSTDRLCSVARQPILDLRGRVHAYELVFRETSGQDEDAPQSNWRETAAHFCLEKPSELKKLTGKLTAFVRCPLAALNDQLERVLPASLTVLEIGPGSDISPAQLDTFRELKSLGYRFALDDFQSKPGAGSLEEFADYIKVDFARTAPESRRELLKELHGWPVQMLAMGVNTHAQFEEARREGFTLFEGYYFCEPVQMRNRRPPVNQMLRLDILKALQQHPMDLHKVSQMVKRDGPITYQLLRLVNSPAWGMRQNLESIEVALVAVGENAFRRIATLAIASEFNGDQPAELLCLAMTRARICEATAAKRGLDPFAQYLLGLLSLLPAMQGQPMSEVARTLPLSDEIVEALLGKKNPERVTLGWLESFERGDWAGCDAAAQENDLDQRELSSAYIEALAWTETALHAGA